MADSKLSKGQINDLYGVVLERIRNNMTQAHQAKAEFNELCEFTRYANSKLEEAPPDLDAKTDDKSLQPLALVERLA